MLVAGRIQFALLHFLNPDFSSVSDAANNLTPEGFTPFAQLGNATVIHGDCRLVTPKLATVDLLLTDPPYGTEVEGDGYGRRQNYGGVGRKIAGDSDLRALAAVLAMVNSSKAAVFASPKRTHEVGTLMELMGWEVVHQFVWDKGQPGLGGGIRYQHENILIATRGKWGGGCGISSVLRVMSDARGGIHPHAKPVALMGMLLDYCNAESVFDPFMGTGATLVAAKQRGITSLGTDLEQVYCGHAAKTLAQEDLLLSKPTPVQEELIIT